MIETINQFKKQYSFLTVAVFYIQNFEAFCEKLKYLILIVLSFFFLD